MGALDGIRVIDASRVLAGPYCGQIFADNGAEVIKIEPPEGDLNRRFPMLVDGESTNYLCVNRGKLNCAINLKVPEGRKLLHQLVTTADIFIQNHLPSAAKRLGTDYETLREVNPDLIYVSISGYGTRGALKERPGYDQMVNAYCGIMALTGEADRPPVLPGTSALDMSSGMLAYGGAVSALLARTRGLSRGQRVDVSLLNSGLQLLSYKTLNWLVGGAVEERQGRENDKLVPHGPYHCQDVDLMIGAGPDAMFGKLCDVIGASHLLEDQRFSTLTGRIANNTALREVLEAVLAQHSADEWAARLDLAGVPCAPVNAMNVVLDGEQVRDNDMVVKVEQRSSGESMRMPGLPFEMSDTGGSAGWAPAKVGEDTVAVLRRILEFDEATIMRLQSVGAILVP